MDIISVYIYITEVKLYSILWDVLCTSPYNYIKMKRNKLLLLVIIT